MLPWVFTLIIGLVIVLTLSMLAQIILGYSILLKTIYQTTQPQKQLESAVPDYVKEAFSEAIAFNTSTKIEFGFGSTW